MATMKQASKKKPQTRQEMGLAGEPPMAVQASESSIIINYDCAAPESLKENPMVAKGCTNCVNNAKSNVVFHTLKKVFEKGLGQIDIEQQTLDISDLSLATVFRSRPFSMGSPPSGFPGSNAGGPQIIRYFKEILVYESFLELQAAYVAAMHLHELRRFDKITNTTPQFIGHCSIQPIYLRTNVVGLFTVTQKWREMIKPKGEAIDITSMIEELQPSQESAKGSKSQAQKKQKK